MPWLLLEILLALPVYALVLFRLGGLLMTAPIYGSSLVPTRVRAGLTMVLAAVIFPLVARQAPAKIGLAEMLIGGVGELMIGASIGLTLTIFFMGVEFAGLMVGRQAGIALAQVYNPMQNSQTSIIGQVYSISLITLFLLIGGHRAMMAAVLDTFEVIPLLSYTLDESIVVLLVETITAAFVLGIRVAAPALIALFLTTTALGLLSRTMPQLNILTIGFTVRVFVALGVAALGLAACQELLLDSIWDVLSAIREAFGLDVGTMRLTN